MTRLVTGSAGHLGEALVRTLRAAGEHVRGLDIKPSARTAGSRPAASVLGPGFVITVVAFGLAACGGSRAASEIGPAVAGSVRADPAPPAALPADAAGDLDRAAFAYDAAAPLDVRVEDRHEIRGIQILDLTYESPVTGRVPAYLYRPTDATAPTPALVLMHGLPGTRSQLGRLALAYAAAGVHVLSISAPYSRFDLPYREPVLVPAPRFDEYDRVEMEQAVRDLRRAVDLLEETEGVDSSRIGYVGFSMGGGFGAILAAVEPRFRAITLMSPTSGLVTWITTKTSAHPVARVWHELPIADSRAWVRSMWPVEPVRWLARAPDRPLLIQVARHDRSVTPEDTARLLAAAPSTAAVRWYDAGHRLNPTAFLDQAAFLAEWLGFDVERFSPPDELF